MSATESSPVVAITFPKAALDFIDQAKGQLSRSAFVRDAAMAAASHATGTAAPSVEMGPGRRSPLAAAAAAHGFSVKEYMRYTAEVAAGIRPDGNVEGIKKEKIQ